jgi:hypothetical protein
MKSLGTFLDPSNQAHQLGIETIRQTHTAFFLIVAKNRSQIALYKRVESQTHL